MMDDDHRGVVLLIGNSLMNRNTAAKFIESNIPVLGIVICNQVQGAINFGFLKRSVDKHGVFKVLGQILERILYKLISAKKDFAIQKTIVNEHHTEQALKKVHSIIHFTSSYENPETLDFISSLQPDFIVIHTPYWVGKKARSIPRYGVIGGHPGITPRYRGIHSPFWAAYNKDFKNIGYTVFWVDAGVDTGDIIHQGSINISPEDSYITLSWRGMQLIARKQIDVIADFYNGIPIKRNKISEITPESNYPHPTLLQYFKFRISQKQIR